MPLLRDDRHRYRTVYYSDFWYTKFASFKLSDLHGDFFRHEVALHQQRLRLLALVFDHVYIPRTHLITSLFREQTRIVSEVMKSYDFRFLRDAGAIRVSTFPNLDGKQDSERISSRARSTNAVVYPSRFDYLDDISTQELIAVPSRDESSDNAITFHSYGGALGAVSKKMERDFRELIARATLGDLPFFHEQFITSARRKLPPEQFEVIWRNTNSIYLTSGAPNLRGQVVPYYNPRLESPDYRFLPAGIDRFLVSPEGIRALLDTFLTPAEVRAYLEGPIDVVAAHLVPTARTVTEVEAFRDGFFDLVRALSEDLDRGSPADFSKETVLQRLDRKLNSDLRKERTIADEFLGEGQAAAEMAGDSMAMGLVMVVKQLVRHGRSTVRSTTRRWRYPAIVAHMKTLRRQTRGA